jgi:hypothetical protein
MTNQHINDSASGHIQTSHLSNAKSSDSALIQLKQAHLQLQAKEVRNQTTATALQALQSALHHFEQSLVAMSPPALRTPSANSMEQSSANALNEEILKSLLLTCNILDRSLSELILGSPQLTGPRILGSDSGVGALRSRIRSILLLNVDGHNLIHYGLQLNDHGLYDLNEGDCKEALERFPAGLRKVLGSTGHAHPSGVLGAFVGMVRSWTDRHTGLIRQRLFALEARQRNALQQRTWLCTRCEQALALRQNQLRLLQSLRSDLERTGNDLVNFGGHWSIEDV